MSLDFKLHYDRLREGDPTKSEAPAATSEENTFYDGPGHARNLCLSWAEGKRQFLSYSYLVGGTFTPGEEVNEIILSFLNCSVTITGYDLETIFVAIANQQMRHIFQDDVRYIQKRNKTKMIVKEILVRER